MARFGGAAVDNLGRRGQTGRRGRRRGSDSTRVIAQLSGSPEHAAEKGARVHRGRSGPGKDGVQAFVHTIILMPCQIVRGGPRLWERFLSAWNEWQGVFLRCPRFGAELLRITKPGLECPVRAGLLD